MPLDTLIARVEERLDRLEPKTSSPHALRELLTRLDAKIRDAQDKGYGAGEIVDLIVECGFQVDPNELKKHLDTTLTKERKMPAKRARSRSRKKSESHQNASTSGNETKAVPAAQEA